MFCKKCGADVGDGAFCPNCGEAVGNAKPVYTGKTVNKIAYGVIAILLGDLGIHRFYAGKWISGIVYLLFFWTCIPGILGLIEGILALIKEDDGNGNIPVDENSFFV